MRQPRRWRSASVALNDDAEEVNSKLAGARGRDDISARIEEILADEVQSSH